MFIVNVVAEHQNLMIVCLRTNTANGSVPPELLYLSKLKQILKVSIIIYCC